MSDGDRSQADLREISDPRMLIDEVFVRLREGAEPERFRGERGVFRFLIATPEGEVSRFVIVEDEQCRVTAEPEQEPGVTLSLSLDDFVALATGELSGPDAFISGRLTVGGDLFLAMRWGDWFGAR
ncbi:SCP2 sterol-binding domain-containing protein [Sinosporangium siamense]|uniref:SCP2 domain-containing protein n=1 Tax=Sinosporangium siamense TaxID=1367973 RepID=A0A919RJS2_9ACTN|nr:SCP2 sterol-binding domain-containing protein [Sinosporangium siamense]GII95068.1 hypothetical protein Ssi02_52990 [Sinosporangium siamense]